MGKTKILYKLFGRVNNSHPYVWVIQKENGERETY